MCESSVFTVDSFQCGSHCRALRHCHQLLAALATQRHLTHSLRLRRATSARWIPAMAHRCRGIPTAPGHQSNPLRSRVSLSTCSGCPGALRYSGSARDNDCDPKMHHLAASSGIAAPVSLRGVLFQGPGYSTTSSPWCQGRSRSRYRDPLACRMPLRFRSPVIILTPIGCVKAVSRPISKAVRSGRHQLRMVSQQAAKRRTVYCWRIPEKSPVG